MSFRPGAIAAIPANIDPSIRRVLESIKENLEVRLRQRGNPLDAAPTFKDLLDAGLIQLRDGVSIGGRNYTQDELLGLVEFTIPDWVTSDQAPPTPTGLVVEASKANITLSWNETVFDQYGETQVWRSVSNNLTNAVLIGSTSGSTYVDSLPPAGSTYYYWIRDIALNGLDGPFNDATGTSANPAPAAPAFLSPVISQIDGSVSLSWTTPTSTLAMQYYIVRYGSIGTSWDSATLLATVNANNITFPAWWSGSTVQFQIRAVDINDTQGAIGLTNVAIAQLAAPSSFTAALVGTKIQFAWGPATPTSTMLPPVRYQVRRDSTGGAVVAEVSGTSARINVDYVGSRSFFVNAVDTAGNVGASLASTPASITVAAPSTVTPTAVFDGAAAIVSWANSTASLPIDYYMVTHGAGRTLLGKVYGNQLNDDVAWGAGTLTRTYYLTAYDLLGNSSGEGSVTLTCTTLGAPSVSSSVNTSDISYKLTWTAPTQTSTTLPVDYYEILDAGVPVATTKALYYIARVTWVGSKTFTVRAVDAGAHTGASGSSSITINAPSAPSVTTQVVDNNVLLYWNTPASTLPIATYEVRRGATWAGGTVVGQKSGGFTTVFETLSGSFTYWVAAIDSAGNYGTPASVAAVVSQPPDYIFKGKYYPDGPGSLLVTRSNAVTLPDSSLVMPIDTAATFAEHFSQMRVTGLSIGSGGSGYTVNTIIRLNTGTAAEHAYARVTTVSSGVVTGLVVTHPGRYSVAPTAAGATVMVSGAGSGLTVTATTTTHATPQSLVTAGYDFYAEPARYTGYHEETWDTGATIPACKVTAAWVKTDLDGASTVTTDISVSLDNVSYTTYTNAISVFATNFRYIRLRVNITSESGATLTLLSSVSVTLDAKLKTANGTVSLVAGDGGIKTVYLTDDKTSTGNKVFIDVDAITLTPAGTTALIPLYDFTDIANPLSFNVRVYNTSGVLISTSATISYTVRGF